MMSVRDYNILGRISNGIKHNHINGIVSEGSSWPVLPIPVVVVRVT